MFAGSTANVRPGVGTDILAVAMKNLVLGSVALIAIGVSFSAYAVKAPPPSAPATPYNWSGFYVGGNFGGAWTSGNLNIQATISMAALPS